jgi:DNA-binding MltR family transcriptional regulator
MTKHKNRLAKRPAVEIGAEIIGAMDEEFHDAPDRILAIVGAAYLDSLLEELLRAIFLEDREEADRLLGFDRPLGSNGSRYQLAYCLGLITENQRDDLKLIAKIRNAFAHRFDIQSFNHAEPSKFIEKLHVGKELQAIAESLARATSDREQQKQFREIGVSGRRKFQDTVRNLFANLLRRLDSVASPNETTWYPKLFNGVGVQQ